MPWLKALPTWLAVNNCNFSSPTGLTDVNTGQPMTGGALNLGDYTDFDNQQAAEASYTNNGILFEGRYRFVQVDSSATAANVKTGTIGFIKNGSTMKSVVITSAGSGQTNGSYNINADSGSGGGVGAIINIDIAGGLITTATVVNKGYGYVTPPTFTVSEGGTPGTVVAQLDSDVNVVTSYDQATGGFGPGTVRPVVFLNAITPGNYGFVQELGTATVLGKATSFTGTAATGVVVQPTTGGVVDVPTSTTAVTTASIGQAIDKPQPGLLFKILLNYVPVVQG